MESDRRARTALLGGLLLGLVENPRDCLNMVAYLMRDDIGLGRIAFGTKAIAQLGKKRRVEIDAVVSRAIKWAHGRLCCTAS